jgi:ribose transport system permease protein
MASTEPAPPVAQAGADTSQGNSPQASRPGLSFIRSRLSYTQERAMTAVLVILVFLFAFSVTGFFTRGNITDILSGSAYVFIVAAGMTVLFIVGEFDLSLGATYGIVGTLIADFSVNGAGPYEALVLGLLIAILIGLVNGLVTTVGGVPSFIVTIGMLSVLEGLAQYVSGGEPITLTNAAQKSLLARGAAGSVFGLPAPLLVGAVVFIVGVVLLRSTRLGAHMYLTGGNAKAARQVGISVVRVKLFTFVFAAFLAGVAGATQIFALGSAQPGTGSGDFLFQVVGAAIIGGVALTGGAGSIYGTFIGAAILGVLTNGLALSGVDPGLAVLLVGVLIIAAGLLQSGLRQALALLLKRARIRGHAQAGKSEPVPGAPRERV